MGRFSQCCVALIFFIIGICNTLWIMKILTGWSWYHLRFRTFLTIAGYRARDQETQLCLSQDNETVISCELAAMTRLIQFRFTKDLKYNTYNKPATIIPYSRQQMDILWNWTFAYPTHYPISVTLNDNIHNYQVSWIVNRKNKNTNAPLTSMELDKLKQNLPKTGVILAIHGGALVMGSANHLIPYLTLLSQYMGELLDYNEIPPPILSFDYRLSPECIFPCQSVDISFIINKYLNQELKVDMNKIFLIGDSSGGSLSLLIMQKIAANVNNHIKYNVGGAVLISAGCDWTLNQGKGSWTKNAKYDPIIFYDSIKLYRNYVFGIYKADTKKHRIIRNNDTDYEQEQCDIVEDKIKFDSAKVSPCFGSFDGLPSLYITVSELEALYDDSITIYQKANNAKNKCDDLKLKEQYENVGYFLEINRGSSLHELPLMAGVIPEATKTLHNIANFFVNLTSSLQRDIHI